jgi:uncharacterized protein DUF1326
MASKRARSSVPRSPRGPSIQPATEVLQAPLRRLGKPPRGAPTTVDPAAQVLEALLGRRGSPVPVTLAHQPLILLAQPGRLGISRSVEVRSAILPLPAHNRSESMYAVESRGGVTIEDWRIAGSYFEACSCEAVCPCRSISGRPGGESSFGESFGAVSWHVHEGHAGDVDLSALRAVMSLHYVDRVKPSTPDEHRLRAAARSRTRLAHPWHW